jgi:hypothetical protein
MTDSGFSMQDRLSRLTIAASAVAAMTPGLLMGLRLNTDLWSGGLLNPDSAMRLVRLDDIVAAGAPIHAVMRDGSGAGTILHWSHLLDSLLLILAAPLAAVIGWQGAIHAAGIVSGPLSMAAVGVAVAWAAAPVASRGWLWLSAFAAGAAPVLGGYGMLGVVHHHVLLALVAVMAGGWALRILRGAAPIPAGIALGAWTAAGVWLSPEALPFALMATGAVWAAWFQAPSRTLGDALLASGCALLLLVALAFAVDPPAAGWAAIEPDRISLPFVLLALGAAAAAAVGRATGRRLPALLCGVTAGIAWLLAFPQILHGTEGLMTAAEAQAFFHGINEMEPVQGVDGAIESLLGGCFATVALLVFAASRPRRAIPILYAAACAAALVGLAAQHVRFTAYPAVAGAVLLPIVLSAISEGAMAPALQSMARLAMIFLLIGAPTMAPLAASAGPKPTTAMPCALPGAIAMLANHPNEVVLAGVNETPDLLYRTPVRTVGSLYHRNPQAFIRLRNAWRAAPGDAPGPEFRATGATLVLACPNEPRSSVVEGLAHDTLLDRLIENRPPSWLHRIADAVPGGFVLYGVSP